MFKDILITISFPKSSPLSQSKDFGHHKISTSIYLTSKSVVRNQSLCLGLYITWFVWKIYVSVCVLKIQDNVSSYECPWPDVFNKYFSSSSSSIINKAEWILLLLYWRVLKVFPRCLAISSLKSGIVCQSFNWVKHLMNEVKW